MKLQNDLFTLDTKDEKLVELVVNYALNRGILTTLEEKPRRAYKTRVTRNYGSHPRWTDEEIHFLLGNLHSPVQTLINRTSKHTREAVVSMVYKLKNPKFQNKNIATIVSRFPTTNYLNNV